MKDSGVDIDFSADRVATCCLAQYDQIPPKGAKPTIRSDGKYEWTVLAGVVLQLQEEYHCIALTTGVKALPFKFLSPRGDLLHDSHAEVLARRGARTWLLRRLLEEMKAEKSNQIVGGLSRIFSQVSQQHWRLLSTSKLHMYCSTFPCGDASSFVLLEKSDELSNNSILQQSAETVTIRGRNSLSNHRLRTKPGRLQSLPSISMSCTDKLAMWSAVGMQGSLLSRWLEPLFFHLLVIGVAPSTSSGKEVVRECERVLQGKMGQDTSTSGHLRVVPTSLSFFHSKAKVQERLLAVRPHARIAGPTDELDYVPAAGSIVWIRGEIVEHIVQGKRQGAALPKRQTDALAPSARSKLSKAAWFALYLEARSTMEVVSEEEKGLTYFEAKHTNSNLYQSQYRRNKDLLRGSISLAAQTKMVSKFLDNAQTQAQDEETTAAVDLLSLPSRSQVPFYGWLVSGRILESFYQNG